MGNLKDIDRDPVAESEPEANRPVDKLFQRPLCDRIACASFAATLGRTTEDMLTIITVKSSTVAFRKFTVPIKRADLVRDCMREIKLWPGCEPVQAIAVLLDASDFMVRIKDYGTANKRIADRALRCIEREKQRRYHVVTD